MRPSRHSMYMAMARAAAMRATCYRLNVGAVLVYDRSVVGVGYNGAPSGQPHCTGNGCQYFEPTGCKVVHAEINALRHIERVMLNPDDRFDLYVTHSPCSDCARQLCFDGRVSNVFFETPYRDPSPVKELLDNFIGVWQLLPSGLVVEQRTGRLVEPG